MTRKATGGALPRRGVLAIGLALLGQTAGTGAALAQDHPPTLPLRDVDVTYVVPTPAGAARQRLRFSAMRQKLRLDPPGGGLFVVIDFRGGRMFTVREADRSVIDMAAPKAWMPGLGHTRYVRGNDITVSGVSCTEWQTKDSEGRDVRICFDADGVMLRASMRTAAGEAILAEATEVRRDAQSPAVFVVPESYRRLSPPPIAGAR